MAPEPFVRGHGSSPERLNVMGRVGVRGADLEHIGRRVVAMTTGGTFTASLAWTSPVPMWSIEVSLAAMTGRAGAVATVASAVLSEQRGFELHAPVVGSRYVESCGGCRS